MARKNIQIMTAMLVLLISIGIGRAQTALQDISSIVKVHTNSEKRVVEIFDSLRNAKFADEFILDMAQSKAYAELAMYTLSIEYGLRALASDSLKTNYTYRISQVNTLTNAYCSINDYQSALKYIHEILDNKSLLPKVRANRTIADMLFTIGTIKHKMGEKEAMQSYFEQGCDMLKSSAKVDELALYSYFLGEMITIAIEDDLARALAICKDREVVIIKIDSLGGSPEGFTDQQRAYLFSKSAYICERLGDKKQAVQYHDKFMATDASKRVFEGSFIAQYYVKSSQPRKALSFLMPVLKAFQTGDTINLNYRGMLSDIEQCYAMMGDDKTALDYKRRELAITDSLVDREKYRQTIELNTIYETEQRNTLIAIQNGKITSQRLWMVIFGVLFLSVVAFLTILLINYRRKKTRNEKRYKEIMAQNSLRNKESHDDQLDNLFNHLEELMYVEKLYLNPDLEREALCQALNTNVTYLSTAIKQKTGQTVMGYINMVRLDYVKILITQSEKLDIEKIALDSGFGSSRTLYRQFKRVYDMTPLDFFKLSYKIRD